MKINGVTPLNELIPRTSREEQHRFFSSECRTYPRMSDYKISEEE
jgi:hypothetical protein